MRPNFNFSTHIERRAVSAELLGQEPFFVHVLVYTFSRIKNEYTLFNFRFILVIITLRHRLTWLLF